MSTLHVGVAMFLLASFATWLFAEFRGGRSARLGSGLFCFLVLIAAIYSAAQRQAIIDAHYSACFRLLGEALEADNCEKAKEAVQSYNTADSAMHPTFRMMDVPTGKQ
jgi:hypothetical protein